MLLKILNKYNKELDSEERNKLAVELNDLGYLFEEV